MKTNSISENLINNNISDNNVNIFDNSDRLSKTGFSNESKNDNVNFTKDAAVLTISNKDGFVREKSLNSSKAYAPRRTSSSNVLKLGSKGDEVKKLQQDLTYLGYDTKGCDGMFGNNTRNAVIRFQSDHKLTADGKVGPKTRSAITAAVNNKRNRTASSDVLKLGSRGDKVAKLQKDLTSLGYNTKGSDGIFGENTKAAVISFQRDHGLTQDGMVGRKTNDAIQAALKNKPSQPTQPTNPVINVGNNSKIISNLQQDTSLGLSSEKKTAMIYATERLLNDGYDVKFIAGILGNIQNEGNAGKFESSNYKSNPDSKPSYLSYMDNNYDYRQNFSGKNIRDVGIAAAIDIQNKAKQSGFQGKFGLGMMQWTADRTSGLLESYKKYCSNKDIPSLDDCLKAEVNFMADELNTTYSYVYNDWKKSDKTAFSAGQIICSEYEKPKDSSQKSLRASNADKIYSVLVK